MRGTTTPARTRATLRSADVDDLAYAIAAAEGFPGWTPWSSEATNAALIARAYEAIHNRAPGTDRGLASALFAPEEPR